MFFRNAAVAKRASFLPILPQENGLQDRRTQRRLSKISTIQVAFAIACVLTVAVWRSQAFLLSRPADTSGARFGDFKSHATRVVTLKGVRPPRAEKPNPSAAAHLHETAAVATSFRGSFDVDANAAAVVPFSLSFQVCNGFANQRLSIVYAAIIAKETGRSLCLPKLLYWHHQSLRYQW